MSLISSRNLPFVGGMFLVVATVFCPAASAAVTEVTFAEWASEYAVDPQTGNIAAVDPANNEVSLYGSDLKSGAAPKPIASVVAGNRPTSVVFKQAGATRLFAVACLAESNIYLFDAATLKQLAKIPVAASDVSSLAASVNPDDPYVYYCYGRGHDSACGRVQVLKNVDEGLAFDDAMDCAISAQGNYAYRRGPWSPSGFESLRKVEPSTPGGKTTFQRVFYDHNSTAQYVCDPFELYTAAGTNLYTVRLDKSVAKVNFVPRCFFDNHPWMAGIEGPLLGRNYDSSERNQSSKLVVASTNTFQKIGELTLPSSFTKSEGEAKNLAGPGDADFKFVGYRLAVIADAKRDRILLLRNNRGLVVPVADLKLPDEPFLFISADTKAPIVVERKNIIKLATKDSRIKVELVDKSEGLELTSNGLEWTPKADLVGEQAVRLKLSYGELERTHTVELNIGRSFMPLPFAANRIGASEDGKSLIAWSIPRRDMHRHDGQQAGEEAVPRCMLIDPAAQKVLCSAALPFIPEFVAVDDHYIYAVQQNAGVVAALGRNDMGHRKQISFDGDVAWLRALGNKELVVGTTDGRWLKYSVPELSLLVENRGGFAGAGGMMMRDGNGSAESAMTRVAEGWQFQNGDVYDEALSKQLLVKAPGTLKRGGANFQMEQPGFGRRNEQQYGVGASFRVGNVEQAVIGFVRVGASRRPLFLTRSVQTIDLPNAVHTSKTTETWAVVGEPPSQPGSRSTVLSKSPDVTQGRHDAFDSVSLGALAVVNDQVYSSFGGRLYQLPLADVFAAKADEDKPPRFKPTQSVLTADLSGTTTLKHQVLEGKPPMQFALMAPFGGLKIEPSDGTVTIDGPAATKALLDQFCGTKDPLAPNGFRGQAQFNAESLDAYLLTAARDFEQITGTKPKGVPVALSVAVQTTDSNPRTAALSYYVLADLPRAQVDARITEMAAEIARLREQQFAQRESRPGNVGAGGGQPSTEVQARIRRLEERILSLEAQINILTKLMSK